MAQSPKSTEPKQPKRYIVQHVPQSSLYKLSLEGGGEIPTQLKSMFTSTHLAKQAIATYNDQHNKSRELAE